MVLTAQDHEVRLHVLGRVVTGLPFGKRHHVMNLEMLRCSAFFTAATGSAQSCRYGIAPHKRKYRFLPVGSAAPIRAVFTPSLWERTFTVKADLLGHQDSLPVPLLT